MVGAGHRPSAQAAGHRGGAGNGLSSKRRAESGTPGCRKSLLVRTGRGPGRGLQRGLMLAGWLQGPVLTLRVVKREVSPRFAVIFWKSGLW